MFSLSDDSIKTLNDKITDTLLWFGESNDKNISDKEYKLRVDELNEECNKLYQSMVNINLSSKKVLDKDNDNDNNKNGTSISSLLKKRQNNDVIILPPVPEQSN